MGRPLRLGYDGALYHITSRVDRREDIYDDDFDGENFLLSTTKETHVVNRPIKLLRAYSFQYYPYPDMHTARLSTPLQTPHHPFSGSAQASDR